MVCIRTGRTGRRAPGSTSTSACQQPRTGRQRAARRAPDSAASALQRRAAVEEVLAHEAIQRLLDRMLGGVHIPGNILREIFLPCQEREISGNLSYRPKGKDAPESRGRSRNENRRAPVGRYRLISLTDPHPLSEADVTTQHYGLRAISATRAFTQRRCIHIHVQSRRRDGQILIKTIFKLY